MTATPASATRPPAVIMSAHSYIEDPDPVRRLTARIGGEVSATEYAGAAAEAEWQQYLATGNDLHQEWAYTYAEHAKTHAQSVMELIKQRDELVKDDA